MFWCRGREEGIAFTVLFLLQIINTLCFGVLRKEINNEKKEYECQIVMISPLFPEYTHFLRIKGCPLSACSLLKVHDGLLLVHLLSAAATST